MPRYGAQTLADCVLCPSGHICANLETVVPTVCDVGHYCPEGSGDPTHTTKATQCTAGHYCPEYTRVDQVGASASAYPNKYASGLEIKCGFGFYATGTGNIACLECNAGKKCPDLDTGAPVTCDPGYICPQSVYKSKTIGAPAPLLCDEGKTTKMTGAAADGSDTDATADCTTLTRQDYIQTVLLRGKIMDGYESKGVGETWKIPVQNGKYCDVGQFCKGGDTFPCGPGNYCDRVGLTADGTACDAGYLCVGGSTNRRPIKDNFHNGEPCKAGTWCASGS